MRKTNNQFFEAIDNFHDQIQDINVLKIYLTGSEVQNRSKCLLLLLLFAREQPKWFTW